MTLNLSLSYKAYTFKTCKTLSTVWWPTYNNSVLFNCRVQMFVALVIIAMFFSRHAFQSAERLVESQRLTYFSGFNNCIGGSTSLINMSEEMCVTNKREHTSFIVLTPR